MIIEPTKYEDLKDVFKVKNKSSSLFDYLFLNNIFDPNKLFHVLTKEEIIENYKKLVEEHLKLLKSL